MAPEKPGAIVEAESETSIGFPDNEAHPVVHLNPPVDLLKNTQPLGSKFLSDVYCLVVICKKHQRIALERRPDNYYFLPYEQIEVDKVSFKEVFSNLRTRTVPALKDCDPDPFGLLIDIWRVEQPNSHQYVTRYISAILFDPPTDDKCCVDSNSHCWMNLERITKLLKADIDLQVALQGNECFKYLDDAMNLTIGPVIREISANDLLQLWQVGSMELSLFHELGYEEQALRTVLNEFVVQCYPSEKMSFGTFCKFCSSLVPEPSMKLTIMQICRMYNCFNITGGSALTFKQIILGFALMEQKSVSILKDPSNKLAHWLYEKRTPYIFRYYNMKQNGHFDMEELSLLLADYAFKLTQQGARLPQSLASDKERATLATNLLKRFGHQRDPNGAFVLGEDRALEAFQDLQSKLQSEQPKIVDVQTILLRSPVSLKQLAKKLSNNPITNECKHVFYCKQSIRTCQVCTSRALSLSDHFIHLESTGEISNIVKLEPLSTDTELQFVVEIPETDIYVLANDIVQRIVRFGNILYSEEPNNEDNEGRFWFFDERDEMIQAIEDIVIKVQEVFKAEERVLTVNSPCHVFGDLHGNLKDLLLFARLFWRTAPFFTSGKYLFLGDYVDRGDWGIEVIVMLFCLKLLCPRNFILVRGNHEMRDMQEHFTFYYECQSRLSEKLWLMINDCFDLMPVAAILDERLFTSHSGIPITAKSIEPLFSIPCPMSNPQEVPEAWQVMWNDPLETSGLNYMQETERNSMSTRGFAFNAKRGTAFIYGEKAVAAFCHHNSIDYIIRANEVFPEGYHCFIGGRVISVFSCTNYVGQNNIASALFVTPNKIRVIRIENDGTEYTMRSL